MSFRFPEKLNLNFSKQCNVSSLASYQCQRHSAVQRNSFVNKGNQFFKETIKVTGNSRIACLVRLLRLHAILLRFVCVACSSWQADTKSYINRSIRVRYVTGILIVQGPVIIIHIVLLRNPHYVYKMSNLGMITSPLEKNNNYLRYIFFCCTPNIENYD